MWETLQILLPETVLGALACLLILAGAFPISPKRMGPLALAGLAVAAVALRWSSGLSLDLSPSLAVSQSALSIGFQWSCLGIGALLVLMSMGAQSDSRTAAEFYGMLLLVLAGTMLVSAANDLVLLFLALELISVPTYVLLYLGRRDYASQEAATKYFLLSVFSAAILLYGFAFLYGLTGNTRLSAIHEVLAATYAVPAPGAAPAGGSVLGVAAVVLILAGLGFKLAAVPFHFYAPDVYEGTSAFNAGLLAVAPKAAGLFAIIRVLSQTMTGFETGAQQVTLIVAAITMTGGNCLALLQTNVRRMLAYSSIAHAGYMLIGIAVGFWESWNGPVSLEAASAQHVMSLPGGYRASLLYLLAYSITTVGLFAVLVFLGRADKQLDHVEELTGLAKTHPLAAGITALFLFSLAGIPPLPGFWAKLSVFAAALSVRHEVPGTLTAINQAFVLLAIIGVINAAIGGVVYIRLIANMFLNDPIGSARPAGGRPALVAATCAAVLVLAFGLYPRPVFRYLERADQPPIAAAAIHVPLPAIADATP